MTVVNTFEQMLPLARSSLDPGPGPKSTKYIAGIKSTRRTRRAGLFFFQMEGLHRLKESQ